MRRLATLLILLFASPAFAAPMVDGIKTISVIADSSLALPITEIMQGYTTDKYQAVVASYVPISQQEKAVTDGVGYDVLITARPKLLETLKQQGLVDIYTESKVAKNRLVLVSSETSSFKASLERQFPLSDIIRRFSWQPGLVIGNPETLLQGTLARQVLRHYQVIGDLEPYTLYEKDLTDMISLIRDEKKLGIVYASDAKNHSGLRVVDVVPEEAHAPIEYVAVVLAGDRMEPAREFVEYLTQGKAKAVFAAYGLEKP